MTLLDRFFVSKYRVLGKYVGRRRISFIPPNKTYIVYRYYKDERLQSEYIEQCDFKRERHIIKKLLFDDINR